jgi:hypothetical protein
MTVSRNVTLIVTSIRSFCVEFGSNTSTVTLRALGEDEKGGLESERVNYGRESQGLGTENDCASEGQQQL